MKNITYNQISYSPLEGRPKNSPLEGWQAKPDGVDSPPPGCSRTPQEGNKRGFSKLNIFIILALTILTSLFLFLSSQTTFAQQPNPTQNLKQEFYKAQITKILKQGEQNIAGNKTPYQVVQIKILDGNNQGKTITLNYGKNTTITPSQKLKPDDTVILQYTQNTYTIYDKYRLTNILYIFLAFFFLVCIIAGWKGFGSILGLGISLAVILLYMLPQILSGANPLQTSIIASLIILLVTTYLAHGISKQTTIALISTFISLLITVWISSFFIHITQLTGINDETSTLLFGPTSHINLSGLLLAGIIIGTLGALNDITTTQAATIFSLAKQNPKATYKKLFITGFYIGREHIVSMVNTLVLAYAGSALTLLLFFILNPQKIPYWVILNNETISDEIIRTLAGSMGLILVVPIVTLLAALVCDKKIKAYFLAILK
jgi:uncharacterized membrane protein